MAIPFTKAEIQKERKEMSDWVNKTIVEWYKRQIKRMREEKANAKRR